MSKEIDLIKCIISEIDDNLYSDFGGNACISYTSNLKKLLLALDTPEVRHFFENYEQQSQRIAELEEQLANSIRPKFKPHNDLFVIVDYRDGTKGIEQYYIDEIVIRGNGKYVEYRDIDESTVTGEDNLLFATYEEAQAKLEELRGK